MKTFLNCSIFIFLFFILSTPGQSQEQIVFDQTTPAPGILSGEYYAKYKIEAKNVGTEIITPGKSILLAIDKNIQSNVNYLNAGSTSSTYAPSDPIDFSPIDKSLTLGSISGNASVSSFGSANYSIPIEVPPGTNGIVPQIGITYNSSSSDGLLGRGWNISGISSIRLVPKTIYQDGVNEGILLRGSDELALDGYRISCNGGNDFSVISDLNSKITSSGLIGTAGTFFTVLTKEGITYRYGKNNDSRLEVNGFVNSPPYTTSITRTLVWYLDKMTDSHGNSINYTYNNNLGEVTLREISYTENEGTIPQIKPYNFIRFYYDKREDSNSNYLYGNVLQNTLLVREIEVFCESKSIRRYEFSYIFESQTYLREIVKFEGNKKLNPTRFKYGDDLPIDNSFRDNNHIMASNLPSNAKYITGDFNGDGKTDIAAFIWSNTVIGYTGEVNLFLNNDNGKTYTKIVNAIPMPSNPSSNLFTGGIYPFYDLDPYYGSGMDKLQIASGIACADFDGDGLDDLIIGDTHDYHYQHWLYGFQGKTFVVCYSNGTGFEAGTTFHTGSNVELVLADITGDGRPEGISYGTWDNSNDIPYPVSYFSVFDLKSREPYSYDPVGFIQPYVIRKNGTNYNSITPIDFNGDGVNEFLATRNEPGNIKKNYCLKIDFDYSLPFVIVNTNIYYTSIETIYEETDIFELYSDLDNTHYQYLFGDFNGDRISDNVRIGVWTGNNSPPNYKIPQEVKIRFGTGLGYTPYTSLNGTGSAFVEYLILDINKDKKADLLAMEPDNSGYGNSVIFKVYYSGGANPVNLNQNFFTNPIATNFYPRIDLVINHSYTLISYSPQTSSEFSTGDFDGDGFPDLIFNCPLGQRCIAWFDQTPSQNLLTSIINGLGYKINIEYSTLSTNKSSFYIRGNSVIQGFPINNFQGSAYFVKAIIRPDGEGDVTFNANLDHTSNTSYHYEEALIHREGKGFIGFGKVTSVTGNNDANSVVSKIINVKEYDYDEIFFESYITRDAIYVGSGFSVNPYQFLYKEDNYTLDNINIFPFRYSDINSTDRYGNQTVKHFDYGINGILTHSLSNLNNGFEVIEVTNILEDTPSGTWITWKPKETIETITRNQQQPFTTKIKYEYDQSTGDLLITKRFPTRPNEVKTENEYYLTGLLKKRTISTPLLVDPLPTKIVNYSYDDKFRFITRASIPVQGQDQIVEAKYDNRFGVPIWQKGIDGLLTQYSYDELGRTINVLNSDNTESTIIYDWLRNGDFDGSEPIISPALFSVTTLSTQSPTTKTLHNVEGNEVKFEMDGFVKNGGITKKIYSVKHYDGWGRLTEDAGPYDLASLSPRKYLSNTYEYDGGASAWGELTNTMTTDDGINYKFIHKDFSSTSDGGIMFEINLPDKNISLTYDATGLLISANDPGGEIVYEYSSNHSLVKTKLLSSGMETRMEYDEYGRQSLLNEKNLGITTFVYNAYGLLQKKTDANSKWYEMKYDELDRLQLKTGIEGIYDYNYYNSGNGINQISDITSPASLNGINRQTFEYDNFGRLVKKQEIIEGNIFQPTLLSYNINGFLDSYVYPNGFAISYSYNNLGYPCEINRADNGHTEMIWHADETNHLGQYTKYFLGNNILTEKTYDNFGLPQEIKSGNLQDLKLQFDDMSYNLLKREDVLRNIIENFEYNDIGIERLTDATVVGQQTISADYEQNGNIFSKTDVGTYEYNSPHPNAVSGVNNQNYLSTPFNQDITYTNFNKVETIKELNYMLEYKYGPDMERKRSILGIDPNGQNQYTIVRDKFYLDNFEITEDKTTPITKIAEVNYINSPTGLIAMFVKENGNAGELHYVYSDHLGSILKLTDGQGNVTAEQNFDAWGKRRKIADWSAVSYAEWLSSLPISGGSGTGLPFWLCRGYTGHEHLDEFQLINMNGRMYDPVIGSMLSPDPFIQDPTNSQNFNRYSYVLNNPLKYTDPSGYKGVGHWETIGDSYGIEVSVWVDDDAEDFSNNLENEYLFTRANGAESSNFYHPNFQRPTASSKDELAQFRLDPNLFENRVSEKQPIDNDWRTDVISIVNLVADLKLYEAGEIILSEAFDAAKQGPGNILEFPFVGKLGTVAATNAAKVGINIIPKGNLANHLFKGAGKLADNAANRALITKIANGKALTVDKFGKSWYRGVDVSGRGIYTYTQNGVIKGAGYTELSEAEIILKYSVK